jgi:3-oxoadipate enol-lactonase
VTLPGSAIWLEAGGIRFHCRIDGPPGAPWLVFSNSLMTNLSLWDDQVAFLGHSMRILRYDQRGHGATDVPAHPCTFEGLAGDVVALLDRLEIARAIIVGVSMGGVTALQMAIRHPDRVAGVAACDAQHRSAPNATEIWEERIATGAAQGMAALVEPTVRRWFTSEFVAADPSALQRVRRMIRDTPATGFIACARALQRYDLSSGLATIRVPTLLLAGEADGQVPGVMRGMHDAIPGSRFVGVERAGHLPNIERPMVFNEILAGFVRDETAAAP